MTLTAKQSRFVEEYILDLNASQAAIRAGYSKPTAYSAGPRLLENVEVAVAIDEAKRDRSVRTNTDADWVLNRLRDELEADLRDIFGDNGELLPIDEWPLIWRKGLVTGIEVEELEVAGKVVGVVRRFKLNDRIRRLELLGKHVAVQAFSDRVEVSVDDAAERKARARAKLDAAMLRVTN